MPDDMEQIEARLAAYIDGTLPAAQRAEIENYLKANPAHAKLISELVSLKTAVGGLPREKAPAEVLDALQSQIERHALLDADEDGDTPSMRITRWPAFGSAAAVLLLAAGLGLLVYQVLPKPKADLAILASTRPGEVRLSDDAAVAGGKPDDALTARRETRSERFAKDEAATTPAATPAATPPAAPTLAQADAARSRRADANNDLAELAMQAPQQNQILNGVLLSQNAPGSAPTAGQQAYFTSPTSNLISDPVRVVVVRTDDPALTQNLLVGSLVADKTTFEFADWPTTAPATQTAGTRPTLDEVMARLHRTKAILDADLAATGARPVILRGVTGDRAYAVLNTLDSQRPGRQNAEWAVTVEVTQPAIAPDAAAKPATLLNDFQSRVATNAAGSFNSTTKATTQATTRPDEALAKSTSGLRADSTTDSLFAVRRPSTSPAALAATTPTTQPTPSSDLVVLVLARPTPAALTTTTPAATTTPATRPTTTRAP